MTEIKEGLILNVQLPPGPAARSKPYPVEVSLVNSGTSAVTINRRMALGYRNHIARELFADLLQAGSQEQADYQEVDYNRKYSPPSDYAALEPGQAISKTLDLFRYYLPLRPGTYVLVLHYQADEELAKAPENVVRGVISSEPVEFLVE